MFTPDLEQRYRSLYLRIRVTKYYIKKLQQGRAQYKLKHMAQKVNTKILERLFYILF